GAGGIGYSNDTSNPGGGGGGMGGAIFNMQGRLTIRASTFTGNFAAGGSVLNDPGPSPYCFSSPCPNRNATPGRGFGGAIFNLSGSFTAVGSTLARDYAANGLGTEIFNLAYDAATPRTAQTTLRDTIVDRGQAKVATAVGLVSVLPAKTAGGLVNRGD